MKNFINKIGSYIYAVMAMVGILSAVLAFQNCSQNVGYRAENSFDLGSILLPIPAPGPEGSGSCPPGDLSINCGGTGTGNPPNNPNGPNGTINQPPDPNGNSKSAGGITDIVTALCTKLQDCQTEVSLSIDVCKKNLMGTNYIGVELGLTSKPASLQELADAEKLALVTPEKLALAACTSEILTLSCKDPSVQSAWSIKDVNDYSNIRIMIPATKGSCPDVY